MPNADKIKPYAIGAAITLVAVGLVWYFSVRSPTPSGRLDAAYAAQVAIENPSVAAAESMMAGGVVYYDGELVNRGDRTLTACAVDLTFRDVNGKALETDRRVLLDDHLRPLPPHARRSFEIGFDKVPAGWNQAPPDASPAAVYVH